MRLCILFPVLSVAFAIDHLPSWDLRRDCPGCPGVCVALSGYELFFCVEDLSSFDPCLLMSDRLLNYTAVCCCSSPSSEPSAYLTTSPLITADPLTDIRQALPRSESSIAYPFILTPTVFFLFVLYLFRTPLLRVFERWIRRLGQ